MSGNKKIVYCLFSLFVNRCVAKSESEGLLLRQPGDAEASELELSIM
jgi:hypothetical protein